MFGHATGDTVFFRQIGVTHMVNTAQHLAKGLAVTRNTPDRNTTEVHTVIAAFTTDQTGPLTIATCAMIGQCDFKRGLNRFRTGVGIEHMVKIARHQLSQTAGQLERLGMAHLERRCVIQLIHLRLDRFDDFRTLVTGVAAPKACRTVKDIAVVVGFVIHAISRDQHTRGLLELTVGRKGHPERRKIVRTTDFRGGCHQKVSRTFLSASLYRFGGGHRPPASDFILPVSRKVFGPLTKMSHIRLAERPAIQARQSR